MLQRRQPFIGWLTRNKIKFVTKENKKKSGFIYKRDKFYSLLIDRKPLNVVCIGDSLSHEFAAFADIQNRGLTPLYWKGVKLREQPSIQELLLAFDTISENMSRIVYSKSSWTLPVQFISSVKEEDVWKMKLGDAREVVIQPNSSTSLEDSSDSISLVLLQICIFVFKIY